MSLPFLSLRITILWILAIAGLLLGGSLVYAQLQDRFAVVESTAVIFPGQVRSSGWKNDRTISVQNLADTALLQEFHTLNSAYIDVDSVRTIPSTQTDSVERTTAAQSEVQSETSDPEQSTVSTTTLATTTPTRVPSATSSSEAVLPADVPDDVAPETSPLPDDETGTTTVFRRLERSFNVAFSSFTARLPFVNSDVTVPAENETEIVSEDAVSSSLEPAETSPAPAPTPEDIVEPPEPEATIESAEAVTEEIDAVMDESTVSSEEPEPDADTPEIQSATTSNDGVDGALGDESLIDVATSSATTTTPTTSTTSPAAPDMLEPSTGADTVVLPSTGFSLELSRFGFPVFDDPNIRLKGGQLRISMAAAVKRVDPLNPQQLIVNYSFDDGDSWQTGGSLLIEEETTNATNGGYFLFALPNSITPDMLDRMRVQLQYVGNPRDLKDFYIDSAWLEVFLLQPPSDPEYQVPSTDPYENGFTDELLTGDTLVAGDAVIDFDFTDDNTDETLIIKSSARDYAGLTSFTSYVSVTNTGSRADEFRLQAYFPENRGELEAVEVWTQNIPLDTVQPEFQPYIYHCSVDWEVDADGFVDNTELTGDALTPTSGISTSTDANTIAAPVTSNDDEVISVDPGAATSSSDLSTTTSTTTTTPEAMPEQSVENDESTELSTTTESTNATAPTTSTTTVLNRLSTTQELTQAAELIEMNNTTATSSATAATILAAIEQATAEAAVDEVMYRCPATQVVRTCDSISNGTDCNVDSVLVREHAVTKYRSDWRPLSAASGSLPTPGLLRRTASFLGFGPDKKEVPDTFEIRSHTPDFVTVQPGETKYFKLTVSVPPLSGGEFWVEAIGNREYGLLDPFWQSAWRKRMPISIDNVGNASSTEQQVFLELDSSLTGFWSSVRDDGGDIRFISETPGNIATWFDDTYARRQPIPITIGANRPENGYDGYTVRTEIDTASLIGAGDMLSSCDDLRVVYDSGATSTEIDRVVNDCNTANTEVIFALQADHATSTVVNDYYVYFNNGSAGGPPADPENVYLWFDDVSSDRLSEYTQDEGDLWHGTGQSNTFAYNASGYYTFDTGDNFNESIRIPSATFSERDVYIAAEWFITGCYPQNISFGHFARYTSDASYYASMRADSSFGPCGAGYAQDGSVVKNTRTTTAVAGTNPPTIATNQWRRMALATWGINGTNAKYWDTNDDASFGPLAWPTVTPLADGVDATDIESSGEVGIMAAQAAGRLRNITVRRYVEPEPVVGTTTPSQVITTGTFTELDHWVQYFSTTTQEADIWVQVDTLPANASTTIYLYYDNPLAESTSDEYAPFTYETPRDLYYVVNDGPTSPLVVYSLINDNTVSLGASTTVLQSGESVTFDTYGATSVISANGPVTAGTADNGTDNVVPISFASTTLLIPSTRGTESVYTYAPFSDASVEMFNGNGGTPVQSGTTNEGTVAVYTNNNNQATIIESDEPVLVFSRNGNNDALAVYPPTLRDLYGIRSNTYAYSPTESTTAVDVFCSSGGTGSNTNIDRGSYETNTVCASGGSGTGNAARLANQTSPLSAIQQADGSGSESSMFLPTPEFGTRYILPQAADYVSVVCAPRFGTTTIQLQTVTGSVLESQVCGTGGTLPGALNFNNATVYAPGTQVVSPEGVPFYVYFEENSRQDETNTWSAVQAKQFRALDLQSSFGAEEENTDAQYTQNNFAWYENTDAITPIDRYSLGGENVAEGENVTGAGAINSGDVLRLRINLAANNGTGTIGSAAFALQYVEASGPDQCSLVTNSSWITVPSAGSTTAAFTGFNNAAVSDGITLPSALLSDSSVLASYEEANISVTLPNQVNNGDIVEFDWVLTAESPAVNSSYCFRMVRSAGQSLFGYDVYPLVETAGPPGVPTLLTPFNNEHASTTQPAFEFLANDTAGDDIDYQIQVSTDNTFSSTIVDRRSDVNLFDFENVQVPADKAPFTNAQRVRFNPPSALANGTTYWWRVRAADPDGSNTFGDWSAAQSFTVNTAVTVTEWFQTTDEQFDTNTLDSAQTSGGDSVELDIAGGNLIGEYGSLTVNVGATTTVNLDNTYTDPVVVVSHRYGRSVADGDQPIIRVFNKGSNSFDFVAYTFDFEAVGTTTVDYIVVEAGEYLMDDGGDGVRVFATSTSVSTVSGTAIPTNPGGPIITFPTSFSAPPTVLAAVTTNNDPQWVVATVYDGTNISNPPTATQVGLYLNDSLASDGHGSAEDVDIIAFDPKTDGTNNGVTFDIQRTPNSVSDTPFTQSFATNFTATPGVILVHQQTMNGADGGYAMVDTDTLATASEVTVAFEEGGTAGARGHANEIVGIVALESAGSDLTRGSNGQITSTEIDFDDVKLGNAWGQVRWNSTGDVSVRVQYQTGSGFQNVPDSALPGNSSGFTSSPVTVVDLDTTVYNELRLVAVLSGVSPELLDWTVAWGQRVETPTLGDPFDNQKVDATTPVFDFVTTDPQSDDLEYEISISTDPTFETSSSTFNSGSDTGFANLTNGGDTNPFASGDTIGYTTQSALTDGQTYWWRVRAKDPNGEDSFSPWSKPDSFTVDTAVLVSTWHQTTDDQFREGLLDGTFASTSDSVEVSPLIGEYGTATLTNNAWLTISTENIYQNMIVVASPEYAFDQANANGRTARVRNKTSNSFEVKVDDHTNAFSGVTEVDYVVMEAGEWLISDGGAGTRIIAGTAEDVANVKGNTSYDNSAGEIVTFSPSFSSAPGAILTVVSDNDPNWVGAHMDDGSNRANSITTSQMSISLARSRADTFHSPEDIDYIAFAVATGTNNGVLFDALNTATNVGGSATAAPYNQTGFTTAPVVTLTQQNANRAGQGSFSQKDTAIPSTDSTLYLSASEIGPGADGHANAEMVSVLAFEASSGLIERDAASAGGLSGTIRSETIDFFDGNGPRFEQFYWNDTTPGASEVRLQVEYLDGTNWNLVPDDDWYDLAWTRRIPITIQASQVEDDLVDFPVYVDLADLGGLFWDNVLGSGADIRVTESDGITELPVDVSFIDTGSDEGELHFKTDLASTTNQTFYVYFGNVSATAYATPEDVWTGYDARHQLGQDPTAATPQFTDSTGNGYNATARSGMTLGDVVAGQVGRAIDLDGNDGGQFDIDFAYPGPFTASMWWNSSGDGFAISVDAGADEKFGPWTSGNVFTRVVGSADDTTLPSPSDGSWHYVVLQRDAADKVDVYIDGVQTRMFSDAAQAGVSDWENFGGQTTQGFIGQLDELRFASGTRAIGWLDTEYNNQRNTGAFYSVGAAQQSSGDALIGNNAGFTGGGPIDISGLDANVYSTIRLLATLECAAGDCPTLDDWSVEWGEGVQMTGTLRANDRLTNVPSGTVRVAVNGVLQAGTGSVSNGIWSIGNVTAFAGDTITVYVEGAADANRAATVFIYNGAGNMTGVEMYEGHLTLSGDNSELVTNANLGLYDNSVAADSDVFFSVDGSNNLSVCAVANCSDFSLYVTDSVSYRPSDVSAGDLTMGGFINEGTFTLDGNTMRVGGSWNNQATSSLGTGEVIFTAAAGTHTVTDHTSQLTFPTLTFGEGGGTAEWELRYPLTVTNDWTVEYGTVDRFAAEQITVSGDISIGAGGLLLGSGTTTFAGTGANTWSDASAGQNLGNVVIEGNSKTVSITSDVYANNLLIGSDDTLQGGSGNVIHLGGDFINTGTFTPNTSTIELVDDERGRQVPGAQTAPWYDTAWSSRYPITIQASQIDADLTDFPVTVDLADLPSTFWSEVQNNGGDIRVTTDDATTEVPREVSGVNVGSEIGELYFKAPTLSSTTDTTFYIYFGNATATDANVDPAYQAEEVWSEYEGVWHFAEGAGSIANDSTSNGNDGTLVGSPTWTNGITGGALGFDGNGNSGNRVTVPSLLSGVATTTVSVWFTQDAVESGNGGWTYVLHSSADDNVGSSEFWLGRLGAPDPEDDDIGAAFGGWSSGLGHTNVPLERDNRYYHMTAVQADGEVRLYVDGQLVRTRSQSMFTFTGEDWGIGAGVSGFRSHPGIIDSPRISTEARSTAWIAAEYRNAATTTDFYSIGAAEGAIGISVAPATPHEVTTDGANLYRFTMNDPVASAAFTDAEVVVQDDFSIATGTVTLPTTRLSVGGDFANTGGVFAHNNAEVRFTGAGTKTIEQQGDAFLNAFYDVSFTGSGNWSYLDTNATTTNQYTINAGSVTFPDGLLTIGDDFTVSGSGGFNANDGEVVFLIEGEPANITPRTSSFANVRIRDLGGSSWFDSDFGRRLPITITASEVDDDLSNFPVFVDLSLLGATFFDFVASDGADIRMTEGDGLTQVPVELVSIDTSAETGELHFRATTLSSTTDSTFYIYFDNPGADPVGDATAFGRNNVWSNGYEAVYHLPTIVDSTGNGYTLTESNISNSSSALMGEAADFNGSNSVYTYGNPQALLNGHSQFTLSMWYESDLINTDKGFFMAPTINGGDNGICARYDTAGASGGGDDVIKGCLQTTTGGNQDWESSALAQVTDYQYYVQTWQAGSAQELYIDGIADVLTDAPAANSGTTNVGVGTMYIGAGSKDTASGGWNGRIDEVRIASVYRSAEWISAEYVNQQNPSTFIATSTIEQSSRRIFTNASVTATGDMVVESGLVDLPTGTYTVGGSFINDGVFNNRSGTVLMNSSSGTAEVAAGISPFGTLTFNGASGDFLVSESATATNAINLTNANEFTLVSGQTLTTLGTFSSAHSAATTTWSGSTLRLAGAGDYVINSKTAGADTYGTLALADGVNVSLWNSSAADAYVTEGSSSIYSQDHDSVDGDLYIFGNYTRSSGTEYWSYATDFDGTDLTGGSERQVNVRGASSTLVLIEGATLEMIGDGAASTTIDAQSNAFTVTASSATLLAEHVTVDNLAGSGFELVASTTITTLEDARFTVAPGRTGITIDGSTVDTNPAAQYFRVDFATTTAGAANNVTLIGDTPSSFAWFRDGVGNLYGEDFDAGDGNPGNIRWDDSNFQINISGTVYSDVGATALGAPTCDGSTQNVRVVVNGGAYTDTTSCDGSGNYSFSNVSFVGDPTIVVYLDTDGGENGTVITKTPTADINDLDIYTNRVMTRHEDVAPLTIADMVQYDESDDSDVRFVAATGSPDTLTVRADNELIIASSTTFAPGGEVTLQSSGTGNSYDGTLRLATGATFEAAGTEQHQIGGSFFAASSSVFTAASSTVTFTATNGGRGISNEAVTPLTFHELAFTGVGGGWNLNDAIVVNADLTVAAGTLTGTADITMNNGALTGDGLLSLGGGTVTIATSTNLGGVQGWTFNNLVLGTGAVVGTTTRLNTATTTVLGQLTISPAHFLAAGASQWDFNGTGTVFVENGTFLEDTSTLTYSGDSATVLPTTYYNLVLAGTGGTPTYTFSSPGYLIENDLVVAGAVPTVADLNTNDPVLEVGGDVLIGANGTLEASDSTTLTLGGSYANNGTFTGNTGLVEFVSTTPYTIAAGSSAFADVLLSGSGLGTVVENATTSGSLTAASTSALTVDTGTTLAVGGVARIESTSTTWTGATLTLFGSERYELNPKTLSVPVTNLEVRDTAQVKAWNLSPTTVTTTGSGALYSQDHDSVDGALYIYGAYQASSGTDHWSYATDFDGTDLVGGGNERAAAVYFAADASATWTGGSVRVIGTSTASTTIQNQGSGTYGLSIGGNTVTDWEYVVVRNSNASGISFAGTPNVLGFNDVDLLAEANNATTITVAGSAINASPARVLSNVIFNSAVGVTGASNVTAVGGSVSGWRFTAHSGNLDGEDFDDDPGPNAGNPGYVIWDDSDAIISISGTVYQDDGATISSVCDGTTTNIRLAVAGSVVQNASSSCSNVDGSYTISGISFTSADELTLYIDGESVRGVTISKDPISSISDMDIYERHVIVRHEGTDPITVANLAVWDQSDDSDILFTTTSGPDTVTLAADTKLLVWNNKTFAPNGDVTIPGGGVADAIDGTLEVRTNGALVASSTAVYEIDGSLLFGSGASFVGAESTVTMTSAEGGRTLTVNEDVFYNLAFTGSGSWTVADATLNVQNDLSKSGGALTLPAATTSVGGSFTNTGGTFDANGGVLELTSASAGETLTLGGSDVATLSITGAGAYTFGDTNATATDRVQLDSGSLTLPSGVFTVGGDFIASSASTLVHNSGELQLSSDVDTVLTLGSNDLFTLAKVGNGTTTMTDLLVALRGDLTVATGTLVTAGDTLSIAGSLDAVNSTLVTGTSTILFDSTDLGEVVAFGDNEPYNVVVAGASGGWTFSSATTTNNFSLLNASTFTLGSGESLVVGGVFSNAVGGPATTWSNTTLHLRGAGEYQVGGKGVAAEAYNVVLLDDGVKPRFWNSTFASTTLAGDASLYSQDHGAVDGSVYIYGQFTVSTSTEYWSYATDFDGVTLSGAARRAVSVSLVDDAAVTVSNIGTLRMLGVAGATTTVAATGTANYTFTVLGGTINWDTYAFRNIPFAGIEATSTPTIVSLSNGDFEVDRDGGTALQLARTALDANPSLTVTNTRFARVAPANVGVNVRLSATSTNAWRFTGSVGNIAGEDYDVDGVTECGSIRWDDSSCLLVEQVAYRWRNDDGGLGVPNSEWFSDSFTHRQQVRVVNNSAEAYSDAVVRVLVPYDADMRSDFADLRFTSSDGVTPVAHWVERQTAGTEAEIWVVVPSLLTDATSQLYMYYGSSTAASVSSSTAVFGVVDDFEDNNISEYSGDTSKFQTNTTLRYGGSYGLRAVSTGDFSTGIARTDQTISQGETIRTRLYVDAGAGDSDEQCTVFAVQSTASINDNYGVCIIQFGTERVSLVRDVVRNDTFGGATILASSTYNFTTSGWYEIEIDWGTDDSMFVSVFNPSGTIVATTSATDSTYSSGGYGFTYWTNHGAWDSFHSRPLLATEPTVLLGAKQEPNGASYAALQNTVSTGFTVNDRARLRVAIENTGLEILDQEFQIEFTPRGAAPTCAAVDPAEYVPVPLSASCGASGICMSTSTTVTAGAVVNDLLALQGSSQFVAGEFVADPNVRTTTFDLDQNRYTEIEYALEITNNATDSQYCFRVTNNGDELDSYAEVPELSLSFDPQVSTVFLNDGVNISLVAGTSTPVLASTTVTDFNGFADIVAATTTFYKSDVPGLVDCTLDDNNCYRSTLDDGCTLSNCSGASCSLQCQADFAFHTDPTDEDSGVFWYAYVEVEDAASNTDFNTSLGVDVFTLRGLTVLEAIDYGELAANEDTGSYNATSTIANIGNEPINVNIVGTDLTDGGTSQIDVSQQRFATSTFTYSACVVCEVLTDTVTLVDLDLPKPVSTNPLVTDELYWGLSIPFGTRSTAHTGTNTFMATDAP